MQTKHGGQIDKIKNKTFSLELMRWITSSAWQQGYFCSVSILHDRQPVRIISNTRWKINVSVWGFSVERNSYFFPDTETRLMWRERSHSPRPDSARTASSGCRSPSTAPSSPPEQTKHRQINCVNYCNYSWKRCRDILKEAVCLQHRRICSFNGEHEVVFFFS